MQNKNAIIEVCVDSIDSSLIAQSAGAYRVELCNNLSEGGTTPSFAQIEIARKLLTIQLYILIRPRGGDFLYNDIEFETIKSDIHLCGKIGCNGVVIGMLNEDGAIDYNRCRELVRVAHNYSMGVTFHRAFDRSADLFQSLEDIIDLGCERILTSGGRNTAVEGISIIKHLVEKADGRIHIMPGSGIAPENVSGLMKETKAREVHGTFRSLYHSHMKYKNTDLKNIEEEYSIWLADAQKIKQTIQIINKITV